MQDTADTEIQVQLLPESEGEVDRVATAHPLVAVVITRSGPVQLMPLVRLVSELRGLELPEVAPRLVSSGGIIMRDATGDEAEALSRELHRQDVPFVLIPTWELPEVEEIVQLFRIRVAVGGLRLRRDDGRSLDLKWKDILVTTCVRLEGQAGENETAPARLIFSVFARKPFACYQLSQNIPADARKSSAASYEPKVRFERLGRAVYESFTRSAQNKGMRILSNYGLAGKWKGLTFEKIEKVHSYNYWLALLRMHHVEMRGAPKPRFSIPWLRRIEFEPEARPASPPPAYMARPRRIPPPVTQRPPIVITPPKWMPDIAWAPAGQKGKQEIWLGVATFIAAICLAIYIVLELAG